ncbi:MAG: hypothetical protein LBR29_03915 [Methylobacteriaceae bacterium]|nr:hypothetical protein [Methylobacteriaceae bacterium]
MQPIARLMFRLTLVTALTLMTAGCGMTVRMPSLLGDDVEVTGSLDPEAQKSGAIRNLPAFDEEDWRRSNGAMELAMDPQGPGTPVSWDNPESHRKGVFTPRGSPFVEKNQICRFFALDLTETAGQNRYTGQACRQSGENWVITSFDSVENGSKLGESVAAATILPQASAYAPLEADAPMTLMP